MAKCLISLGSNLGDRTALLDAAVARLTTENQIRGFTESRRFETAPIGGPTGQNYFLNSAARCETTLSPTDFLSALQRTENELGRLRKERWGERAIDLDLLLYDELILHLPNLQLPHPRMAFRRFVLEPAVEVAPQMVHPTTGWTIERLWNHLRTANDVIAITGNDVALCEDLRRTVAEQLQHTPAASTRIITQSQASTILPKLEVFLTSADESPSPHPGCPMLNLSSKDIPRAIQEIVAAAIAIRP